MNSDKSDNGVFEEYEELGPQKATLEQYVVALTHVVVGITISVFQFNEGLQTWFTGFGIVTPLLLIVQGGVYLALKNPCWYKEQMIPFILEFFLVTEIESERYVGYHRKLSRSTLVLGWIAIIMSQFAWTYGLTIILPNFSGTDIITRILGELIAYVVIFGPFLLYVVLSFVFYSVFERYLESRNSEIRQILDIEKRWLKEHKRRATTRGISEKSKEAPF